MTPLDFQTRRLELLLRLPGVIQAASAQLGYGNKALPAGVLLQYLDDALEAEARPKPVVRVFAKHPGEAHHAYDIAEGRDAAIKAVRAEGYPRAFVLIPNGATTP